MSSPTPHPAPDSESPYDVEHLERLATLGAMAAGAAHEVNNLLTPALAYAQLAERSGDQKLLEKAAARTIDGVEAAARILATMLEFSRPNHNEAQGGADIDTAVQAALNSLPRAPETDGITVNQTPAPNVRVVLSSLQLHQIILNLLLNAQRVLRGRSGATLNITVSSENNTTHITVSDNGPGIAQDQRERIFAPFVSLGSSPTQASPSTGLGLAICRRVVHDAGGTIEARETDGGGATFVVTLPTWVESSLSRAG